MKALANPVAMKEINTNIVRSALLASRQATKQQLAQITGLSTVTVGTILNQLASDREVFEADLVPSNGGRPARQYCYNKEYRMALILYSRVRAYQEVIYCGVLNLFGECVERAESVTDRVSMESFDPLIETMLEKYPAVRRIGFGLPGVEREGVMVINDYEGLTGVRFSEYFRERYRMPVIVENDANLAALGFCRRYSEVESTVVYLYFPQKYPPGAGVVVDGRLFRGAGFAGELENLPVDVDWMKLDYGNQKKTCKAVAKVVTACCCIINPSRVVLSGEFLTEDHVKEITERVSKALRKFMVPAIGQSASFDGDFEYGLGIKALEAVWK